MRTAHISLLIIALALIVAIPFAFNLQKKSAAIHTFEECKEAGYPIQKTYPAQCQTPDGWLFEEVLPGSQTLDLHGHIGPIKKATRRFTLLFPNGQTETIVVRSDAGIISIDQNFSGISFDELEEGVGVHVQGERQPNGEILARKLRVKGQPGR